MKLTNQFSVPVPVAEAWETLLDLERVAPCLPGASVDSLDGDVCQGRVKIKVGPISMAYQGEVTILERDVATRTMTMSALGKEVKGTSKASARVIASLAEVGGATEVTVETDLDLTGKPAQFGRGIITDVSNRLIGAFATNLSQLLVSSVPETGAVAAGATAASGAVTHSAVVTPAANEESLDLLGLVAPRLGRAAATLVPVVVALVIGFLIGRRRR